MKTAQERAGERRREKLAAVEKQIRDGSLVVRQMTAEERARYPARTRPDPVTKAPSADARRRGL